MSEPDQSLNLNIARLVQAMHLQTQAINRLAASNEALVTAMGEAATESNGEEEPTSYLSGRVR
ncbi:hypothetical protein [Pseudorhodoferax sp. Leaf274]|uniref:hypothetical protein n=1 Tax=Pseudorhodoferax sp. Leaf274 TaxID=1736318 RepID=UPI000703908E|nr:hypothetical protein [Pseudorhodoferax sp. Leaf274]KQP37567.1 hypothetical protein ASF44_14590 [Pseudorhodoferax sp. Leaf274]